MIFKQKWKTRTFIRFMVINGVLTSITSLIIVASLYAIIGMHDVSFKSVFSVFIFVLVVTTVFFAIIFRQGKQLRSEQEQLITVFEHISDGMLILNERLDVVRSNPAASRLLQVELGKENFNFCTVCSNYPGVGKICSYDKCFVIDKVGESVEIQLKTGNGKVVPVSITTSRFSRSDGETWTVLSIHEVSDHRKDEQSRIAKMVTHSILQAQERERKRISRELHDGIGQSLYSILIQTEVMESMMAENDQTAKQVKQVQETIRQTIDDIRHLSVELRPSALDDLGLIVALRTYLKDYGYKFGIQVNFSYDGDKKRLSSTVETAIYRIVQEALINAVKYAQTERVDVLITQTMHEIKLIVKDYGVGFDPGHPAKRGVGLYSMEERARILGGTFHLSSQPNSGTLIEVNIPIEQGEEWDEQYTRNVGR
ncbi:sensor histidine kinase [Microaerobacter geothermalis]|uniref:sensor histidine kinase n=1 Tax=Microaerobacter geothermalis TaxID=674972 RepID=UPI001F310D25|nr:sensor histidine kinase [Microaerobacter geothermalis]MCF6092569.1 sensor histidine kinase [Microaerobacter geothermalis]